MPDTQPTSPKPLRLYCMTAERARIDHAALDAWRDQTNTPIALKAVHELGIEALAREVIALPWGLGVRIDQRTEQDVDGVEIHLYNAGDAHGPWHVISWRSREFFGLERNSEDPVTATLGTLVACINEILASMPAPTLAQIAAGTCTVAPRLRDFRALRAQKRWLVQGLADGSHTLPEQAEGLLTLLEAIQDHHVDVVGATEAEVFGDHGP